MISLVEALNFRSLRYISQAMGPFHALIGPNASGKSTFLDVIGFLHDVVVNDITYAFDIRGITNIEDMFWNGQGDAFELAVEATIPEDLQRQDNRILRYEMKIGLVDEAPGILEERLWFKQKKKKNVQQQSFFPLMRVAPTSIMRGKAKKEETAILTKAKGRDNFYPEDRKKGKGWFPSIQLGPKRSALSSLYEDEAKLPVSLWFKRLLTDGVQTFILNSQELRKPSPPHLKKGFRTDGSNLPWMIRALAEKDAVTFTRWLDHIRTALPDVHTISTHVREDDRHCYLKVHYAGGAVVPSWLVSDGTLRLLALTLPAYLPDIEGIYLIEEPENGVHPVAVKTITDSLQSVYGAQVLVATHSSIIMGELEPDKILCFGKTEQGGTDIVLGSQHPQLLQWQGTPGLDTLFAAGVLG